ncbi:MAG: oligosaccharide flippase family protein [Bacteroidales bacterium]
MKKFFVTNLLFILTLNILIKSFWLLGVDREVQNVLSAADYGIYYALLNFTYLFNIILDLGITQFNNRTIAQNSILLKKYFAKIIPLKIFLAGVYAIVLIITAKLTAYDSFSLFLLRWLCIFQILTSLLTYLRSNISALMLFKIDSLLSVLDKSITILLCSLLLWTPLLKNNITIEQFIYVQVFSMGISSLIALIICLGKTGFIRLDWDWKFMVKVLKFGFPYALLTLLMSFYNRMDTVMIERILPDGDVQSGIYASGFRLVDSVNMIAYLFSVILLPLFAKMIKEKKDIKQIVSISFQLLLFMGVSFVVISMIYSDEFMNLLYNKHIKESSEVYRVLSFCFIPISMTYVFGTLLTANGSLKKLNIVAASGMIVNIVVNLVLIPNYKALGSAYSALTAQTFTALLQIIIALKLFGIHLSWRYCTKIILFIMLIYISAILIGKINILWYYKVIISLPIFVIISFVCKIFSIVKMKNYALEIIKSKK